MFSSNNPFQNKTEINIVHPVNWMISYPRSGNTFLRGLIANYVSNSDQPLDLDQIIASTAGEHEEKIYYEVTGKTPVDRGFAGEMRARVAYLERVRKLTNPQMPMIKSHFVCGKAEGYPTFRFTPGDRIVHLVRHPCDVAISVAHYYGIDIEAAIDQLLRDNTCYHGHPNVGYEVIGSWFQHTRSWLEPMGVPVFRASYADLVTKTEEILTGLVKFLGLVPDKARIARTIDFSQFSRMQSEERKNGFRETANTAIGGYFRDGRPGQWLEKMTIQQAQRILDHDPALIDMLGFQKVLLS